MTKIKTSFVRPEMQKTRANILGFNIIVHFCIRRKLDIIQYDTLVFLIWLRTGSNPADINQF